MKTLIAYGTKSGTSKKCAEMLAKELTDVTLADLRKTNPDVSEYDQIVVGGSIRAGRLNKAAKRFIKNNAEKLKSKRIAFFICNSDVEGWMQYAEKNIDAELLKCAVCADTFGGEINVKGARGLERMFLRAVERGIQNGAVPKFSLHPDRISAFAQALKNNVD